MGRLQRWIQFIISFNELYNLFLSRKPLVLSCQGNYLHFVSISKKQLNLVNQPLWRHGSFCCTISTYIIVSDSRLTTPCIINNSSNSPILTLSWFIYFTQTCCLQIDILSSIYLHYSFSMLDIEHQLGHSIKKF